VSRRLPIASTTKLMTAYVALKSLPLRRRVPMAPYAAIPGESLLGVPAGARISVRDLLYGLILSSGNDAAHTLAVASAGSEPRFVRRMNLRASALGLIDTHYANPIGLDEAGNYSSARDLVALGRKLLRNAVFRRIADSTDAVLNSVRPPREIFTRNTLLLRAPWATGIKTGHTLGAGYVLVGSGRQKGVELVSAVLGAPSEVSRDLETLELLSYGFSLYDRRRPVRPGQVLARAEIEAGDGTLPLLAGRGVAVGVRRGQSVEVRVRAPDEVEGPIRRGRRLGAALVEVDGRRVALVPLRAARFVAEPTGLDRAQDFAEDNWIPLALGGCAIILLAATMVTRWRRRPERSEAEMRAERERREEKERAGREQRRASRQRRRHGGGEP
jgi:D-alanyl-D-alanine carboxypeptidase (penicillin-binding protein 5/6)